jgi:hypothetical protein
VEIGLGRLGIDPTDPFFDRRRPIKLAALMVDRFVLHHGLAEDLWRKPDAPVLGDDQIRAVDQIVKRATAE